MNMKHAMGPLAQTKRPRRWGIPSAAQWRLMVDCIEKGGAAYQGVHSLTTMKACTERGWVVIVNEEGLMRITEQGLASVSMNAEDEVAASTAIAKAAARQSPAKGE